MGLFRGPRTCLDLSLVARLSTQGPVLRSTHPRAGAPSFLPGAGTCPVFCPSPRLSTRVLLSGLPVSGHSGVLVGLSMAMFMLPLPPAPSVFHVSEFMSMAMAELSGMARVCVPTPVFVLTSTVPCVCALM